MNKLLAKTSGLVKIERGEQQTSGDYNNYTCTAI